MPAAAYGESVIVVQGEIFDRGLRKKLTCIHFQKYAYIVMISIEIGGSNDNSTASFTTFTQESNHSRGMRRIGGILWSQFILVSTGFPDRPAARWSSWISTLPVALDHHSQ